MKKVILLLSAVITLYACGAGKTERQAEKTFKGDWVLTSITYPNSTGFVDVTLFGDASANCFRNSEWHFISNNKKGTYNVYGPNCMEGNRNFVWNVLTVDADTGLYDFTLKPVPEGENARKISTGYRLKLTSLTENAMVWEQTVSYEGKPFNIRMSFVKQY